MPKPTGPTNPELAKLIAELRAKKTPFHSQLAKHLAKPRRQKKGVTLFKINKAASDNDSVFVPGKVLSSGSATKKINVYALGYSSSAKEKIEKAGGKALMLKEALGKETKGRIVV
ncbi:MAG: 50S ribosomal protein L18e [Candidatus Aenigmarchaeota archaeon]|nr:50S ribosomal protein L18e [Candidatus Aenigmarchaeota archaeon]